MRVTLESTDRIVILDTVGGSVEARVWQGATTRDGVPMIALVVRVMPEISPSDPEHDQHMREFERDLRRTAAPRPVVAAIPGRLIL